jgi:LDH2 family malate/lactate/ureidoglycolate dehydrogenase
MAEEIRAIPPATGFDKVRVPGDPEKETYKKRIEEGIPLTQEIIEDYMSVAKELGVKITL